jgi:GNAT superfamily N-acetyltransferase
VNGMKRSNSGGYVTRESISFADLTEEEKLDAFFPLRRVAVWTHNAAAFPKRGKPNSIIHVRHADTRCLGSYDAGGKLARWLFYEKAGNFDVAVRKDKRRQGHGTKLLREAMRRWDVNLDHEIWTPEGAMLRKAVGCVVSHATHEVSVMAIALKEKERYEDGSVWLCSGCNKTFNASRNPKRCVECGESAHKLLRLPADRKPARDDKTKKKH